MGAILVSGRWTNMSCEDMFGSGASPGDLAGKGAPCWKQRRLNDAMKELTPRLPLGVRIARASVYDTIHGTPLDAILRGTAVADLSRDWVTRGNPYGLARGPTGQPPSRAHTAAQSSPS